MFAKRSSDWMCKGDAECALSRCKPWPLQLLLTSDNLLQTQAPQTLTFNFTDNGSSQPGPLYNTPLYACGRDVASLKKGWLCWWWLGWPLAPNCDVYSHRQCLIQLDFITHSWGWFTRPKPLCKFVMLVWSWSWFVMIFYLLSNVLYWWRSSMIYVGVGDVAAVDDCWCRWQLRRSRVPGHQDVISMFTLSFYSKKSESEMLKILLLTALAPSDQDVLPSLTFVFGLFVVVAFVVFSPLDCSIMQHFVCVV